MLFSACDIIPSAQYQYNLANLNRVWGWIPHSQIPTWCSLYNHHPRIPVLYSCFMDKDKQLDLSCGMKVLRRSDFSSIRIEHRSYNATNTYIYCLNERIGYRNIRTVVKFVFQFLQQNVSFSRKHWNLTYFVPI